MNIEELRDFCLSLPHAKESFPFDDVTLVMKVGGKMFALIPLDVTETSITVKCEPDEAIELREKYRCVQPAFHMNKSHWNTLYISTEITENQIKEWISNSYELVKDKLTKRIKNEFGID